MNNVMSAFLSIKWEGEVSDCSSDNFGHGGDIVFFYSPLSNGGTKSVIEALAGKYRNLPKFRYDADLDRHYLEFNSNEYRSGTYDVVEDCHKQGTKPAESKMSDYAMVVKADNPWSEDHHVIVLAGIRGIGAWGAG